MLVKDVFRQVIAYPLAAYSHKKPDSQKTVRNLASSCFLINFSILLVKIGFHVLVFDKISFNTTFFFFSAFLISNTLNFHCVKKGKQIVDVSKNAKTVQLTRAPKFGLEGNM